MTDRKLMKAAVLAWALALGSAAQAQTALDDVMAKKTIIYRTVQTRTF